MRTVIAHLWNTDESAVAAVLNAAYTTNNGRPWVARVADDSCLYIDVFRQGPIEYPDWATRFERLGGPPALSVAADISGRHNGWEQVEEFLALLLSRFRGLAEDDNSDRLWTLAELQSERHPGRRFGEYWRSWGTHST